MTSHAGKPQSASGVPGATLVAVLAGAAAAAAVVVVVVVGDAAADDEDNDAAGLLLLAACDRLRPADTLNSAGPADTCGELSSAMAKLCRQVQRASCACVVLACVAISTSAYVATYVYTNTAKCIYVQ